MFLFIVNSKTKYQKQSRINTRVNELFFEQRQKLIYWLIWFLQVSLLTNIKFCALYYIFCTILKVQRLFIILLRNIINIRIYINIIRNCI